MTHQQIDQRSLKMAQMIARRIEEEPALLEEARNNLERWLRTCSPDVRPPLLEWQRILEQGVEGTLRVLRDRGENSTRLRQSSPFVGAKFITQEERLKLIKEFSGSVETEDRRIETFRQKQEWKKEPGNRYTADELEHVWSEKFEIGRPPPPPEMEI